MIQTYHRQDNTGLLSARNAHTSGRQECSGRCDDIRLLGLPYTYTDGTMQSFGRWTCAIFPCSLRLCRIGLLLYNWEGEAWATLSSGRGK